MEKGAFFSMLKTKCFLGGQFESIIFDAVLKDVPEVFSGSYSEKTLELAYSDEQILDLIGGPKNIFSSMAALSLIWDKIVNCNEILVGEETILIFAFIPKFSCAISIAVSLNAKKDGFCLVAYPPETKKGSWSPGTRVITH